MSSYTICPKFIEFARQNKKYINDVLMVFVPDNSKTICIDNNELILKLYEPIIKSDKELTDWYKFLTMTKDSNFTKVNISEKIYNLPIQICEKTFEKQLITNCTSNYSDLKTIIDSTGITILHKDLAKIKLNYENVNFPKTSKSLFSEVTICNIFEVVIEICEQFKDVIENKGLFKLLVNEEGERVHENKAQLLFFAIAYSHCSANDLKLSPEVNSGNGPVDFNISKGFKANINVEIKFADNSKLEKGLWSQLQIYNKAENAKKSIYLIIRTNNLYDTKINKLCNVLKYRKLRDEKLPEIIIIDSLFKISASKR